MNNDKHEPALYSIDQHTGKIPCEHGLSVPEGDDMWNGWVVREHTLFGGSPVSDVVAYCVYRADAARIRDALRLANAQATQNAATVQVQLDGKDIATAVITHMATVRNSSGTRNF